MKFKLKIALLVFLTIGILISTKAQAPAAFKYQAVIRKKDGTPILNQNVKVKISILQNGTAGTLVFSETHNSTSNAFGVIALNIGDGSERTGNISEIDWSIGPFFIKIEMDESGGSNYSLSGISQLLSVPFSMYANSVATIKWSQIQDPPNLADTSLYLKLGADLNKGDMAYYDGNRWNLIPVGKDNQVLTLVNGKPQWSNVFPLPTVITDSYEFVTHTVIKLYGSVNANGQVITIQFRYGTGLIPDKIVTSIPSISKGYNADVVTAQLSGLIENTTYYYQVVALSKVDTVYGNIQSFKTQGLQGSVTDIDGIVYSTISIGNQQWMAESLKTTKFNNGDLIATTNPITKDISTESTPIYMWAPDGDDNNIDVYGRLYTWYAAMDARKLCPNGWHIPLNSDWDQLITFLGGESIAGEKSKEAGLLLTWAGLRSINFFKDFNLIGYYISATASTSDTFSTYSNGFGSASLSKFDSQKFTGYSIRCIKD